MADHITDSRSGSPYCFDCGHTLDRKGICWNCYDREHQESQEDSRKTIERFKSYRDGRWLVDSFIADGLSEEQAIAEVQDPVFIGIQLFFDRLDHILADRLATEALRQLLIEDHRATLESVKDFLSREFKSKKGAKRGPKAKRGEYKEREILRLKRAGKTNGQIAKILGTKTTIVAAAYNNITKKIAIRQQKAARLASPNAPRKHTHQ
jgi:hypothetical protein